MSNPNVQKATFGAGCFWGTEKFFKKQFGGGLISSAVGYMGGDRKTPSYEDVCSGQTGHAEVLHLEYDSEKVKYEDLVNFFFRMHDPTTLNRQGNDRGTQYRSVIFTHSDEQDKIAKEVRTKIDESKKFSSKVVTQIVPAGQFWKAEEYHQKYLDNNPGGYCNHRLYW